MGQGFFREKRTGVVRAFTAAGGDRKPFLQSLEAPRSLADRFPNAAFAYGIAETNQHAQLPWLSWDRMPE
jgi:hypothetical protein